METDILIRKFKTKALKKYHKELKKYNSKENQIKFHLWQTLKERMKIWFQDCTVSGVSDLDWYDNYLTLFLNKEYNVAKDVMLFFEENEPLISLVCGSSEYKFEHDQKYEKYIYSYPKFTINVYYGSGRCKRVKIGEKSKVVKENIYEIECY